MVGYIGSTVFALPMKGQATTAINDDGTLTSIIWETTTVQTLAVSASGSVSMSSAGVLTSGFNEVGYTKLADVTYYDSKIQDVNFYDVAFVSNSNMSNISSAGRSYLSGIGMPSDTYDLLTLGASNTEYTAPANGWFHISAAGSSSGYLLLRNADSGVGMLSYVSSGQSLRVMCPCRKGANVKATYTATLTSVTFRFVYNVGEV